jgi:hypothetical protein
MKATPFLLLAICLFSSDARSQSPFDGTWIIDTGKNENLVSEKPRVLSVADGCFARVIGKSRPVAPIKKFQSPGIGIQSVFGSWTIVRSR